MAVRTQVSRLGTDSFILARGRKSRLKEREHGSPHGVKGAKSNYFRRNQMAQVTYRGVSYDTDRNKAKQTNKVDLTYRGVRQEKELTSLK